MNIRVTNREELLSIKSGNLEYDDLLDKADDLIERIEKLYLVSNLQETPDEVKIKNLLFSIREELYK